MYYGDQIALVTAPPGGVIGAPARVGPGVRFAA